MDDHSGARSGARRGQGVSQRRVLEDFDALGIRTYIAEPDRGRRKWGRKVAERDRLYANRRRLRGARNKRLQRKRCEVTERSFAHLYETGGMRRLHLRGRQNILKRLLAHGAAFNLGLMMRERHGAGTPRGGERRMLPSYTPISALTRFLFPILSYIRRRCRPLQSLHWPSAPYTKLFAAA